MHVQIVQFRLRTESSRADFLRLTRQMMDWLETREGFVAYELYEGADQQWSDRIAWETAAHARAGQQDFLQTPTAGQLIAMVEPGYASFFGEAREVTGQGGQ